MGMLSLLLLIAAALPDLPAGGSGTIRGVVLNRSAATPAPCQAEVELSTQTGGRYVPFRRCRSDARGHFRFDNLPVGSRYHYRIGANRDEVEYPGPRIVLTEAQSDVAVELDVCDAVARPNPLVLRNLEIVIVPEPGALRVTESLLIENPSSTCYVGEPLSGGGDPVTLALAIPAGFERITFREEFYGRHSAMAGHRVATGIPWPPGRREVQYAYVLPNDRVCRRWERPLDLPCYRVRLSVRTSQTGDVCSNLARLPADHDGEVLFESDGALLPAGHMLRVELGHLPANRMDYAKPAAVMGLAGLIAATGCVLVWRRRKRP
ncbi:MAG: carboxypeptidase-like regulatory domain-containing protein [Thermoguttaceae bacterium]|jgi:hypothetical protein